MKKTLVALAVTAVVASASATTIYENEGTKVDFYGSLRAVVEKGYTKVEGNQGKREHSVLRNAGSRFGIIAKHELDGGLYALGKYETRFASGAKKDGWGDVTTHTGIVGLGHKDFGQLTLGRQLTIGDDIGETGFDYAYGISPGLIADYGTSVLRYDYTAIDGLTLSADYRFGNDRDANNEINVGAAKNGYDVGALYTFPLAEGQKVTVEAGYSRDNFATGSSQKHYRDAWEVGTSYTVNNLKLALDGSQAYDKDEGVKTRTSMINVAAKYTFSDIGVGVYGGYGYEHSKVKGAEGKVRKHKYLIGTDYKLHKHVVTFAEARIVNDRTDGQVKKTDSNFGVGMRVFW